MIFTRIMIHSKTWPAHLSSRNGIKRVVVKKFQLHQWLKSPFLKPNLMKPGVEKEWSACCMMWGQTPSKMSKQKWIWKRPLKKYIHKWAYQYLWKRWFFSEQYCGDQIWQSQIGSFCSYQLTEANSVATVDISSAYTCHKLYEITPKKRFLLEPEKTNFKSLKFHKMKSYTWRFYLCFLISCESWNLFSWAPVSNCLWCYYR